MKDDQYKAPLDEHITQFWKEVAEKIEQDFHLGHPSIWQQGQINKFLQLLEAKIPDIQPVNYGKLKNPGISAATFRRIFISKESRGNASNKDLFAWLLGYGSFQDYLMAKNMPPLVREIEKPLRKKPKIFVVSILAIALLTALGLLYFYM